MFLLNRLSIQSKLIVLLLIVSLGSIVVVFFIGYTSAEDALRRQVQHQLQGQRVAKTNLVRALLENTRDQVISLADSRVAVEGMRDFRAAYRAPPAADADSTWQEKLREFYEQDFVPALARNFEAQPPLENYFPRSTASRYLQYHYIVANPYPFGKRQALEATGNDSAYDDAHRKYHHAFAKIAGVFGFEDVVLVDADTLDVVYSYRKTAHLATDLENGPYADTNLGSTVRAVRKARDRESFKLADFEP